MKTNEVKKIFDTHGYVIIKDFLEQSESQAFLHCAQHLAEREEKPGEPMKYFEKSTTTGEELLNRVENFVDEYDDIKKIILSKKLNKLLTEIASKKQILFKDKINFKLSGGGGFAVHQDAPAFSSFTRRELLVVMVPVDASNLNNGCMQVSENYFNRELIQHVQGTIPHENLESIRWKNIELCLGDIFVFSSFLIHRSADNISSFPRRCFYLTFNNAEEGDMRLKYFDYKRKHFPPRIERSKDHDFSAWKTKLAKPIL